MCRTCPAILLTHLVYYQSFERQKRMGQLYDSTSGIGCDVALEWHHGQVDLHQSWPDMASVAPSQLDRHLQSPVECGLYGSHSGRQQSLRDCHVKSDAPERTAADIAVSATKRWRHLPRRKGCRGDNDTEEKCEVPVHRACNDIRPC